MTVTFVPTCARMSFMASLDSSSLLPKIRNSLNIRTWRKRQVSSCVSSLHKWLTDFFFWCLPAGKDRLCPTRHVPESNRTWLSSSGFSPTVGPARNNNKKTGNKPKVAHLSTPCSFIKCSLTFMTTFSKIKVINCHISGSSITNPVVTSQWLKSNISEVLELKHWS